MDKKEYNHLMEEDKKILEILDKNKNQIIEQEKKIDQQTKKLYTIEGLLKKLLKKNQVIITKEEKAMSSELNFFQKYFVNKSKKHKVLVQLIIVFAVVMVWRGLWQLFDQTPIISSWEVSILVGLLLLWIFNRFTDLN